MRFDYVALDKQEIITCENCGKDVEGEKVVLYNGAWDVFFCDEECAEMWEMLTN